MSEELDFEMPLALCSNYQASIEELKENIAELEKAECKANKDNQGFKGKACKSPICCRKQGFLRFAKYENHQYIASMFATWRLQGKDAYEELKKLLIKELCLKVS